VTKLNATIDSVERIPDMLRQAFRVATTGAPGPVHLQFAGNEGQIDQQEALMDTTVEPGYGSVPPFRPSSSDEAIRAALAALARARRPVMVAGGGVRTSGAGAELMSVAERLQIPVATSLNGKDTIPGTHPLSVGVVGTYSRGSANQVVLESDLVCFIGTTAGGMTTHFWKVPPLDRQTIQIDIDPEVVGRNYSPSVAINADARSALTRMLDLAGEAPDGRDTWVEAARSHVATWRDEYAELLGSDQVPIRPERLCAELTELVPNDGIVVVDTGHAGMWMGGMYDVRTADQSYLRSAGHLGWAFPASLGAKCGQPERPVVCFTGDSGFWYHIGDIETAVRWGINTITVVNDNHSGNQSIRGFDRVYGGKQTEKAREMWVFTEVDFAALANQIGAVGIRVEKPSELEPAFDQALSADRPVVIDVVTDIDALAPLAVE
jgi:acetolactate synthase-1/2/3 large subunit